jgi:hypothetical protein
MKKWGQKAKLGLIGSKVFKFAYLVGAPFFAKPLDFMRVEGEQRPRYARHKWFWTLPLLPATYMSHSITTLLYWIVLQNPGGEHVPGKVVANFMSVVGETAAVMTLFMAGMIYLAAATRFAFHAFWSWVWRRSGKPHAFAPLVYFVVHASGGAFWLAVMLHLMVQAFMHFGLNLSEGLENLVKGNPNGVMIVILIISIAFREIAENRRDGMLPVYGGSNGRLFLADASATVAMFAFFGLFTWIMTANQGSPTVP